MCLTSVINTWLKNIFQLCKAKKWNQEYSGFFATEGEKLVTDDIKNAKTK